MARLALTHRSWCAENPGHASNERLEFLGDAVLGLVITDHVFTAHPELPEGTLARVRAAVVCEPALVEVADSLELGTALLLGKGEDASGGRAKASILSDAMEAMIGAVYIDGGLDAARAVVLPLFAERVQAELIGRAGVDAKSALQELVAKRSGSAPSYDVTDDGPEHAKRFVATVSVDGDVVGRGEGRTKKAAEQAAAEVAVATLSSLSLADSAPGAGGTNA